MKVILLVALLGVFGLASAATTSLTGVTLVSGSTTQASGGAGYVGTTASPFALTAYIMSSTLQTSPVTAYDDVSGAKKSLSEVLRFGAASTTNPSFSLNLFFSAPSTTTSTVVFDLYYRGPLYSTLPLTMTVGSCAFNFNGLAEWNEMWNHILFHIPTTCVTAATVAGTVTATVAGSLTTQVFDIAWVDLRAPTADDYKPVTPLPCLDSTMFLVTPDAATTYNAQNPTLAALTAGCKAACPAPYDTPMNRVCTNTKGNVIDAAPTPNRLPASGWVLSGATVQDASVCDGMSPCIRMNANGQTASLAITGLNQPSYPAPQPVIITFSVKAETPISLAPTDYQFMLQSLATLYDASQVRTDAHIPNSIYGLGWQVQRSYYAPSAMSVKDLALYFSFSRAVGSVLISNLTVQVVGDSNHCFSDTCKNGASCTDKVGDFICTCGVDWDGKDCTVSRGTRGINRIGTLDSWALTSTVASKKILPPSQCNGVDPCIELSSATGDGYAYLSSTYYLDTPYNLIITADSYLNTLTFPSTDGNDYALSIVVGYASQAADVSMVSKFQTTYLRQWTTQSIFINATKYAAGDKITHVGINLLLKNAAAVARFANIGLYALNSQDLCASSPCKNGGRCIQTQTAFTCECRGGFTGDHCEKVPAYTSGQNYEGLVSPTWSLTQPSAAYPDLSTFWASAPAAQSDCAYCNTFATTGHSWPWAKTQCRQGTWATSSASGNILCYDALLFTADIAFNAAPYPVANMTKEEYAVVFYYEVPPATPASSATLADTGVRIYLNRFVPTNTFTTVRTVLDPAVWGVGKTLDKTYAMTYTMYIKSATPITVKNVHLYHVNSWAQGDDADYCPAGQYKANGVCTACNCNGKNAYCTPGTNWPAIDDGKCYQSVCDPFTGACDNCQLSSTGTNCDQCTQGLHTEEKTCIGCWCNGFATTSGCDANGVCIGCLSGATGNHCETCPAGQPCAVGVITAIPASSALPSRPTSSSTGSSGSKTDQSSTSNGSGKTTSTGGNTQQGGNTNQQGGNTAESSGVAPTPVSPSSSNTGVIIAVAVGVVAVGAIAAVAVAFFCMKKKPVLSGGAGAEAEMPLARSQAERDSVTGAGHRTDNLQTSS